MGNHIFHIAANDEWARSSSSYVPKRFVTDGFIHCSTAGQLDDVANRLFRGRSDLRLLTIDPGQVDSEIRYENLEGGETLYPHIYGPINVDAVVEDQAVRVSADGTMVFGGE